MTPERHHELSATLWDMDARAEVERVDVYPRGRTAGSHQFQAYHAIPPDVAINMTEMNPYARVGVPTNRVAIWTTVRSRPTITFVKRFHRFPNIRDKMTIA